MGMRDISVEEWDKEWGERDRGERRGLGRKSGC